MTKGIRNPQDNRKLQEFGLKNPINKAILEFNKIGFYNMECVKISDSKKIKELQHFGNQKFLTMVGNSLNFQHKKRFEILEKKIFIVRDNFMDIDYERFIEDEQSAKELLKKLEKAEDEFNK